MNSHVLHEAKAELDLIRRRNALHAELTNALHLAGTQWWTDRVEEMAWINGKLERLGSIPAL